MGFGNKIRGIREIWQFENRWWLAVTRVLFPGEQLHIYRYKGMDILVDHARGDANGAREVLTSPMYKCLLPRMKFDGPANVLDFGGNNGGFPLLLQTSGIELGKVVSLELNPQTFVRLRFNLERNLTCEVEAVNAALCGEARMIEVALGAGNVADNIYERTDDSGPASESVSVPGRTFDDVYTAYFDGETIDICKIDIEGAEFEVMLRPQHANLRNCRYLIMEIHEHGEQRASEILPAIENLGFVRQMPETDSDPWVHFFINSSLMQKPAR